MSLEHSRRLGTPRHTHASTSVTPASRKGVPSHCRIVASFDNQGRGEGGSKGQACRANPPHAWCLDAHKPQHVQCDVDAPALHWYGGTNRGKGGLWRPMYFITSHRLFQDPLSSWAAEFHSSTLPRPHHAGPRSPRAPGTSMPNRWECELSLSDAESTELRECNHRVPTSRAVWLVNLSRTSADYSKSPSLFPEPASAPSPHGELVETSMMRADGKLRRNRLAARL